MVTVLIILATVIVTWIVSMVATLVVGIILVILIGVCIKMITGELPQSQSLAHSYRHLDFFVKTLSYSISQFAGFAAGFAVLSAGGLLRLFPVLIAVVALSCLLHLSRSTGRVGRMEVPLTKLDKVANIIGTVTAIVLGYLFLY